ncbi:MAG: neutral/alkaline non-lysosomal ceramidase N-terminal domain-containing protein [Chloroflexota bacterium]|nr:neutral/alkaline non-lysosomal ceramidase N-terminal domain-containing protein [Chloroflexota bacterium]
MAELKAGFGVSLITPKMGSEMAGYSNREGPSTGVHDDLHSRALVVEGGDCIWALSSNEMCFLTEPIVAQIREQVAKRTPIPAGNVFICTTHTHSGPYDNHPEDWERPLADLVADAIMRAYESRVPARLGAGRGRLDGYTINRRFIDQPTDPSMAVLRVADPQGNVLGLVVNWNCHAVVLGYDNLLISADFPGLASTELEERLGEEAVVLYVNGSTGNVNPCTSGVRAKLTGEYAIDTMAEGIHYYGTADTEPRFHIGDRGGGTFEEVEELGQAVAEEAWKITQTIRAGEPSRPPWVGSARVKIRRDDAPPLEGRPRAYVGPEGFDTVEVMALGVGEMALVGEPGEVFVETFVDFKRKLWQMGFGVPMAASYANGFFGYLVPAHAFPQGGYEVGWAQQLGLREDMQERMWETLERIIGDSRR